MTTQERELATTRISPPYAALVMAILLYLIAAALFVGVTIKDFGSQPEQTSEDLTSELADLNARIEALWTAIDNGDNEGMFSTAGTTVQWLMERRDALIDRLNRQQPGE